MWIYIKEERLPYNGASYIHLEQLLQQTPNKLQIFPEIRMRKISSHQGSISTKKIIDRTDSSLRANYSHAMKTIPTKTLATNLQEFLPHVWIPITPLFQVLPTIEDLFHIKWLIEETI